MDRAAHPGSISLGEEDGVLLYYKFVPVPDPEAVKGWFLSLCSKLRLVGRIRVAPNGVNVTIGGKMVDLRSHTEAVAALPLFGDIDFKLATCTKPVDFQIASECQFHTLSVRIVKEIVTLGLPRSVEPPRISNAGQHVSPMQFHKLLQDAVSKSERDGADWGPLSGEKHLQYCVGHEATATPASSEVVVVDARNIYETSIGKFYPPSGVLCLDPMIRQYSDLPKWMDQNEERLRGKQILMYCTGGIRCEMASAYLRDKGKGFQDVLQLSGGIQRYLEAFPDGGFFKGKNFVFDHRISVPSLDTTVVGSCLLCAAAFDDYSARLRCSLCRMLVLVCNDCHNGHSPRAQYICSLCQKRICGRDTLTPISKTKKTESSTFAQPVQASLASFPSPNEGVLCGQARSLQQRQRLRILCLHGFRQNASSFKGRTAAFRKKLRTIADFIFVDAPHIVPSVFQSLPSIGDAFSGRHQLGSQEADDVYLTQRRKYAWLVSPESLQHVDNATSPQSVDGLEQGIFKNAHFSPLQYKTQTSGWAKSWEFLQKVFREEGPFDGLLGFSQGAAIAAALCPLRCTDTQKLVDFKFVICCSGYPSPAPEHVVMSCASKSGALFDCPSLHVFGGGDGHDRQITPFESEQLASLFESDSSVLLRHEFGHLIPSQSTYTKTYKNFLCQFQSGDNL